MSVAKKRKLNHNQDVKVVKEIAIGTVSLKIENEHDRKNGHTHQWTVYLRPFENEDMSVFVKEVHFILHDSYENPIRVVSEPPYRVDETAKEEFPITIKIFFQDESEEPVSIIHKLKFSRGKNVQLRFKTFWVSEYYDELVFINPSPRMHSLITNPKMLTGEYSHECDCEFTKTPKRRSPRK